MSLSFEVNFIWVAFIFLRAFNLIFKDMALEKFSCIHQNILLAFTEMFYFFINYLVLIFITVKSYYFGSIINRFNYNFVWNISILIPFVCKLQIEFLCIQFIFCQISNPICSHFQFWCRINFQSDQFLFRNKNSSIMSLFKWSSM